MKAILCFIILLFSSSSYAEHLNNYKQIISAISEGKLIRIIVDYTKCAASKNAILPNNAAMFTPNPMAVNTDGSIGTYIMYFTTQDGRHPGMPVYEYGRYVIYTDNTLKITFTVLNAADYTSLEGDSTMICKIGDGAKIFTN